MDYVTFERRLLHLIFRSNAPLTPVHVAYYLDLPIAEARMHLDRMVSAGVLELDSDDAGHLLYAYPLRPPLAELPAAEPRRRKKKKKAPAREKLTPEPAEAGAERALVRRERTASSADLEVLMVDGRRYYSPAAAAALSLFLPGVGQIYTGRVPQGVAWMLATGMGYLMIIPGLILHICCVVNAAAVPARVPIIAERLR